MIVSFKFNVMNFVEIVVDFYLHIISHVSQVFSSCTHYTSYSLLNFVHVIVCDFSLANQVWKFLVFYAKCAWSLRFWRELFKHLNFGKTGFKTCDFEKHFISYSCILFTKFHVLRSFCNILLWFSRNCFFQNFDQSKVFFDQSKLRLKFWFGSVCFDQCSIGSVSIEAFSIDWTYFLINRKSYREFF